MCVTAIMHVRVEPAANGITNAIVWGSDVNDQDAGNSTQGCAILQSTAGTPNVQQGWLDVSEYNSSWAQSVANPVPIYVDASGIVQSPY